MSLVFALTAEQIKGVRNQRGQQKSKGSGLFDCIFRSNVDDIVCGAAKGGFCFDGNTVVIVGPGGELGAVDNSLRMEWVLACTGVAFIGRTAVARLKRDDDDEDELPSLKKRNNLPGRSDETDDRFSETSNELAPQWSVGTDGLLRMTRESTAQSDPRRLGMNARTDEPPRLNNTQAPRPTNKNEDAIPAGRTKSRRGWLISAVSVSTLLLMLACLWQATPPGPRAVASAGGAARTYQTTRIPLIRPIDWVLAGNPTGERDLQFGEIIEPKQWRLLKLVAPKKTGGTADVCMARPLTWLFSQWQADLATPEEDVADDGDDEDSLVAVDDARLITFDPQQLVGRTVYISVPECGIDGHAQVLAVEDCPNLKPRPGPDYQLVTATFKHHNAQILDLRIEGTAESIGTTPNHPFWSEDKQQFVRADELQPGERLRGADGTFPRVVSATSRPGTHDVYNLEVHLDHVYHVANNGVLVHNGSEDCLKFAYRSLNPTDVKRLQNGLDVVARGNVGGVKAMRNLIAGSAENTKFICVTEKFGIVQKWGDPNNYIRFKKSALGAGTYLSPDDLLANRSLVRSLGDKVRYIDQQAHGLVVGGIPFHSIDRLVIGGKPVIWGGVPVQ